MNKKNTGYWLYSLYRCGLFFLATSFVVTCCMLLFLEIMQKHMGTELTKHDIELAAKITFGNIVFFSLLCTVIDEALRWYRVTRPVRKITTAAEKIMQGDLSVRIQPIRSLDAQNSFNIIIDYFNRMTQELSGIETLRTDFIANVSHELKTPLAIIQNYGSLLQQPDLQPERRQEYAKIITDTSRRLADLITNILKLNKLENQQIYPEQKVYNLSEQLCECLLTFEEIWEQKNIEIDANIEENVFISTDSELLSLVWNNLLANALKFTPNNGRIAVTLRALPGWAIVDFSDTGCGISPDVGAHIFEKFYQGDTAHATQGNGLGLALVKRIIDIVDGEIAVSSQVGQGSSFTVKIRSVENE